MSKITFTIQYAGLQLQVFKNDDGEDVTPLKPISDLFGLQWEKQRTRVADSDYYRPFLGVCTLLMGGAGGQNREQTCILVSRVAAFLMSISPEKVKAMGNVDGAQFLASKQTEWADALHDYEELGTAVNLNHAKVQEQVEKGYMRFAALLGVKNKTEAKADRLALEAIMQKMAERIGIKYQPDLLDT